jgi:hypothetical protein
MDSRPKRERYRKSGKGVFIDMSFRRKDDKKRSERYYVKIPRCIVWHDKFPFKDRDKLTIRIDIKKGILIVGKRVSKKAAKQ